MKRAVTLAVFGVFAVAGVAQSQAINVIGGASNNARARTVGGAALVAEHFAEETGAIDPADSLFRRAREVLNGGDNSRAAELFKSLVAKYPGSPLAPDALYWRAYALYRGSVDRRSTSSLFSARTALQQRIDNYPDRTPIPDAEQLMARINAEARAFPILAREVAPRQASSQVVLGTTSTDRDRADALAARQQSTLPAGFDCLSNSLDPRVAAARAIGRLEARAALVGIRELLSFDGPCDERIRVLAVALLADIHDPAVVPLLITVGTGDPSTEVRGAAFAAVGKIPTRAALRTLDSVFRTKTDPFTRQQVLSVIAKRPEAAVDSILRRIALDETMPGELRRQATNARAISLQGERDLLRRLQKGSKSATERAAIQRAIDDVSGAESERFMTELVLDPSVSSYRTTALSYVVSRRPPVTKLISLYDQLDGMPELQGRLIDAMLQRADSAGIEKVIAIAKTGGNSIVGKKAVASLATLDDPRVAGILLDLIRHPVDVRK